MATHPNFPHCLSPLNLGAGVTPIRSLLVKIVEKAREKAYKAAHTQIVWPSNSPLCIVSAEFCVKIL